MLVTIIISLVLGAISGWLAGLIMKSDGSLVRNIILGIVGGVLAGVIFKAIGISFYGYVGTVIESIIGACILIYLVRLIRR